MRSSCLLLYHNQHSVSASILRHPSFAFFWFSRVLSTLAFTMQAVAVGWQLYSLTGSAFDLGLVGLCQFGAMF